MQYIKNDSTIVQKLVFSEPISYVEGDVLKFTSYVRNFNVAVVSVTSYHHFAVVQFQLTATEAEYFSSGSEYKVQFGTGVDYVQADVPANVVIEYGV